MNDSFGVDPSIFLDEHAAPLIAAYFDSHAENRFTGRRFERLAGGGDHPDRWDRFDSSDLVAVTMLSVGVPAEAAIWILEDGADYLSALLREIRTDVTLDKAPSSMIKTDSHADHLWRALEGLHGIGSVTAGKLCARKRPHLLPVYDAIVKTALGKPELYWQSMHRWMQEERHVNQLKAVRDDAAIGDNVSLLRILDIAIWMRCHGKDMVASLRNTPPPRA